MKNSGATPIEGRLASVSEVSVAYGPVHYVKLTIEAIDGTRSVLKIPTKDVRGTMLEEILGKYNDGETINFSGEERTIYGRSGIFNLGPEHPVRLEYEGVFDLRSKKYKVYYTERVDEDSGPYAQAFEIERATG